MFFYIKKESKYGFIALTKKPGVNECKLHWTINEPYNETGHPNGIQISISFSPLFKIKTNL